MHVKRHLSRIFGSFRRKDHKKFSETVLNQLQTRTGTQTTSRWELLDYDQEDLASTQFPQAQTERTTINPILLSHKLKSQTLEDKENGSKSPLSYHEVQVELTRGNSLKSKWKRRSMSKKQNEYKGLPKQIPELDDILSPDPNVTSVVQQINDTISLINEFRPEEPQVPLAPFQAFKKEEEEAATITLWPSETNGCFTTFSTTTSTSLSLSTVRHGSNNPDTDSKVEQASRLTRGIWEPLEKEIINLTQNNEEMRAHSEPSSSSLFVPDDPIASFSDRNGTLPRESPTTISIQRSSFSSSASRPGATGVSSNSNSRIRNSGRRLYNTIHKRFSKKSVEEKNTTTTTAKTTFSDQDGNKGKEIKSIGGDVGDGPDGRMFKRNVRERASTGRLTRSFRKAISFPRPSFKPLDNHQMEQEIVQVPSSSSRTTDNNKNEFQWKETDGGMVKLKRKLSLQALRTPGKGMRNVLKKGVTAFGKSMIHASAAMPAHYDCPTNYTYPEAYWEDEDYTREFRRYCQSAELDYQGRLAQLKQEQLLRGNYQYGYCP